MISLFDTCPSFTGHVLRSYGSFRMPEIFDYLNPRKQFLLLFSYFIFPFFLALCSAAFVLVLLALLSFSGESFLFLLFSSLRSFLQRWITLLGISF